MRRIKCEIFRQLQVFVVHLFGLLARIHTVFLFWGPSQCLIYWWLLAETGNKMTLLLPILALDNFQTFSLVI